MHHILRFFLLCTILTAAVFTSHANACLWDYDTLKAEAAGLPGITEIITGRFDRFPPLYYEMRLDRVATEVESDPDNLDLYDNAGVACDRLGRSDEAIGWMAKKRAMLDILTPLGGDLSDHEYRYLANLGTFHIHRWLKNGANREDMDDVIRSRDLIAAAIKLNPEAHFGRERYQLFAIEWILDLDDQQHSQFSTIDDLAWEQKPIQAQSDPEKYNKEVITGLSGLISLGAAWESIDIFYALSNALGRNGDSTVAHLAMERVKELVDENHHSLNPLFEYEYVNYPPPIGRSVPNGYSIKIRKLFYPAARVEADEWVSLRNAYAIERLERGLHPDTSPDFWNDWHETTSPPRFPANFSPIAHPFITIFLIACGIFALIRIRRTKGYRRLARSSSAGA